MHFDFFSDIISSEQFRFIPVIFLNNLECFSDMRNALQTVACSKSGKIFDSVINNFFLKICIVILLNNEKIIL